MRNLFSAARIKNTIIKNRIVLPPMVAFNYAKEDGMVTDRNLQHYEERAKGGVGLIIVEATCVNPKGKLHARQLGLWSDDHIEGFRKIVDACHKHDAKVLIQIHHAGFITAKDSSDDIVAPSEIKEVPYNGDTRSARALTVDEIIELENDFVQAAVRAKTAGADGIELHGAHGYLISQFLSPFVNQRNDLYGGSLENRVRFAVEIVKKIRQATSRDFIIGCRVGCNEPTLDVSIEIAKQLEQAGVDVLHISSGIGYFTDKEKNVPPAVPEGFPNNWIVYGGTQIRKNVTIPVIVVNGIRTPEQADYLLQNDLADFTAIGKSLLVDPEWVTKAQHHQPLQACKNCKRCMWFKSSDLCPGRKAATV